MNDEVTIFDPSASTEYERQVALQSTVAAILFVGEGIIYGLVNKDYGGPIMAQCVARAKELVTMVEDNQA